MATATALNQSENAQLMQTIEMFEVITQSQPQDYQSLEILKEAYSKLGREDEVVSTAKRIAQAYVQLGQLSSAILEYETILQRYPDDPDVQEALRQIEAKATSFAVEPTLPSAPETPARSSAPSATAAARKPAAERAAPGSVEDGRQAMFKVFVNSKIISAGDFDLCWRTPDMSGPPAGVIEPFIQLLADKAILPVDNSLKLLSDRTRLGYLPLEKYDPDLDLTRTFPGETCQRWCVLPFDRMSKSILVATANPFNQQAAKELAAATPYRLLWYLAPPIEIVKNLRKAFR
jgi:tetratricopeptide (TPR) repeat protein